MARETVTGLLDGIEISGSKITFKVKRNEKRDFPDWYIGYFEGDDSPPAPRLKSGNWYSFECDTVEKTGRDGKTRTYYNLISAKPASEGASAPQRANGHRAPVGGGSGRNSDFRTPEEIMACYALDAAAKVVVALIESKAIPAQDVPKNLKSLTLDAYDAIQRAKARQPAPKTRMGQQAAQEVGVKVLDAGDEEPAPEEWLEGAEPEEE